MLPEPGPKLDVLVAEKVMRLKICDCPNYRFVEIRRWDLNTNEELPHEHADVPPFSTKIKYAWRVVREMEKRGFEWGFHKEGNLNDGLDPLYVMQFGVKGEGRGRSPEHAICLAALAAMDFDEKAIQSMGKVIYESNV